MVLKGYCNWYDNTQQKHTNLARPGGGGPRSRNFGFNPTHPFTLWIYPLVRRNLMRLRSVTVEEPEFAWEQLSLPKCGLDKHLRPYFHGPWLLPPPFSRTVKWERMHTQASYNRWLWTIRGGTILRMLRRYLTKVVGIANTFLVCFPISRSSSPDSGFNLNTNLGLILRVVVCITFSIILSVY